MYKTHVLIFVHLFLCTSVLSLNLDFLSKRFVSQQIHESSRSEKNQAQIMMQAEQGQSATGGNYHMVGVGQGHLTIPDILPRTRSINIFATLTRDIPSVSKRLEDPHQNSTLLAPLNSAMQSLKRKPWEDRPSDKGDTGAAHNRAKADQNLQNFLEEHIVPVSPWLAGKENKIKSVAGHELWWEERDGNRVIFPGELIVDKLLGSVRNGEVWALKGVVGYAYN